MAPQHQYMDFMEINRPLAGRLAMARKKDIPRLKFAEDRLFYKYFEVFGDRKYEVTDTRHVALDRSAAARFVARQMELMNEGQSEADAFAKTAEEMETDRQVQHAQYHFSADYVRRGDPPAPPSSRRAALTRRRYPLVAQFKELTGFESAADYFKSSSFRKDVHPLVKHPFADRIKEMESEGEGAQ